MAAQQSRDRQGVGKTMQLSNETLSAGISPCLIRSAMTSIASRSVLLIASSRGRAGGHYPRQLQSFRDPTSVVFAIELDRKLHEPSISSLLRPIPRPGPNHRIGKLRHLHLDAM